MKSPRSKNLGATGAAHAVAGSDFNEVGAGECAGVITGAIPDGSWAKPRPNLGSAGQVIGDAADCSHTFFEVLQVASGQVHEGRDARCGYGGRLCCHKGLGFTPRKRGAP